MKTWISLFILILCIPSITYGNCATLPIKEVNCATKRLIDAGIRIEAIKNGWNVYQWPDELSYLNMIYVHQISGNEQYIAPDMGYLYFVDQSPGALYDHPTEFIFVSKNTGAISRSGFNGPPVIGGVRYFANPLEAEVAAYIPNSFPRFTNISPVSANLKNFDFKLPPKPDNKVPVSQINWSDYPRKIDESDADYKQRVYGYYEKPQSELQTKTELRNCKCNQASQKTYTVVISGYASSGERADMDDLVRQLVAQGRDVKYFRSKPKEFVHDGVWVRETNTLELEMFFSNLASEVKRCCDEVEVFMGGHGSKKGSIDLNTYGQEEIYKRVGNNRVSFNPKRYEKIGTVGSRPANTAKISKWLDKIKSCRIRLFLYSCFSGAHIENGINKFEPKKLEEGCHCRTVMTTSSKRQKSFKSDINFFTSSLKEEKGDMLNAFFNFKVKTEDQFKNKPSGKLRSPLAQSSDCLLCKDHDQDGLLTGTELFENYSDPKLKDTDSDGLTDQEEKLETKTNPRLIDTDGDKVSDGDEVRNGTDPLDRNDH